MLRLSLWCQRHIPSPSRSLASAVELLSQLQMQFWMWGVNTSGGLPASGDMKLGDKCPYVLPAKDNCGRHPTSWALWSPVLTRKHTLYWLPLHILHSCSPSLLSSEHLPPKSLSQAHFQETQTWHLRSPDETEVLKEFLSKATRLVRGWAKIKP